MIQIFEYKSTGVKHKEEHQFFKFVVKSRFNEQNNRSLQWCRFDGLKVICETLEPSIIDFVKLTLKKEFKCDTLDELKNEVEKFTKHYAGAIKARLS